MLKLPYNFDIDNLINEYTKVRKMKMTENYKKFATNGLKLVKKELNLNIIDKESLDKINDIMKISLSNSASTHRNRLFEYVRSILTVLFNYKFNCVKHIYDYYNKNKSSTITILTESSEHELINLYKKFENYLNTLNLSKRTKDAYFGQIKHIIVPLKEYFINDNITREIMIKHIQEYENNAPEEITTKIQDYTTSIRWNTKNYINTFNKIIESEIIESLKSIKKILKHEIIPKNKKVTKLEKDYFSEEEMELLNKNTTDIRDKLILNIFLTTGMRIGGLININIKGVYDENFNVLKIGETLETKGKKIRKFVIFYPLKQVLEDYIKSDYCKDITYNSPLFMINNKRIGISKLHDIIRLIFYNSNLEGHNTHSHAFRKTVVIKLMKEGNTLENVSKFIGHSSSMVTAKHYWVPTTEDLLKNMNMQWLFGENNLRNIDNDKLASISSKSLQLEKITNALTEGFIASERLKHVMNIINEEQMIKLEELWTEDSKTTVFKRIRETLADIIQNSNTISDISSILSSINE